MTERTTETAGGIRTRFRAHIREEVKRVALVQLAAGGPPAVSVNAIAKELGVSGPALYRYFASRDELLTELVVDAYRGFAADLRAGLADPSLAGSARLSALAHSFRDWALRQPERYRLMFAAPLPDFDAQSETLVDAAHPAMDVLIAALDGNTGDRARALPRALTDQLGRWSRDHAGGGGGGGPHDPALEPAVDPVADLTPDPALDPAIAFRAVTIWAALHGLVSLEIGGNFASMGLPENELFDAAVDALLG